MRPDMGRCITERPRANPYPGSTKGYKKQLQKHGLDFVGRESIKEMKGGTKEFTDVLGPLVGFLKSRVGKPWNSVHSEISKALPATGGVSYSHARDHLFQMVELHTQIIDGELCDSKGEPCRSWVDFYVDQKGFLREKKAKRWKYRFKKPVFQKTDAGEWIIPDKNGVLMACVMAPYKSNGTYLFVPPGGSKYSRRRPTYPVVRDAFLKETISSPNQLKLYSQEGDWYCTEKRQLGKREIKKYKLREKAK